MKFEVYQSLYGSSLEIKTPLIVCDSSLVTSLLTEEVQRIHYPKMVKLIKRFWDFKEPANIIVGKICVGTSFNYSRKRITKRHLKLLLQETFLPNYGPEHNQKLIYSLEIPKDEIIENMFGDYQEMEIKDIIILATLVNSGEI